MDRVGPYVLVRRLGTGGMGEVWEAVLEGPGGFRKPVALKRLRAGPRDEWARDVLLREARLGALLQHPNVVATYAVVEHRGTWHVAMELVHGASLAELLRAGPLPASAVVEVGLQAAAALAHVHALRVDGRPAGLVHRDVKPPNLLVDRYGLVKLADLGISTLAGEAPSVAGSPGFAAPEQMDGHAEPRSDLFSLGATLYVAATRAKPFGSGPDALRASRDVEGRLADPSFLAPVDAAVPGLAAVLRRCLRARPEDRPASAREVVDALAAVRARQAPGPPLTELVARVRADLARDPPTPISSMETRIVRRGNLPPARDRFHGREHELREVTGRIRAGERWVVLLGPGGMGKTRLALEAARVLAGELAGAWAFDLTEARSVDGIVGALASALAISLDGSDPVTQIGRVLAGKGRALVLLDNLEQCVRQLPATVARWLELAPDAAFLGTSRIAPRLAAERTVPVGPLRIDDALALFRDRAPVPVPDDDLPEAIALCEALDGMPLAIELAAARLRTMPAGAIRSRLGLQLLAGGDRGRPERHRSVTASLEWSWELLSARGRSALAQLSVFEGSFALEAAEAVLDVPGAPFPIDLLQELVEACLLRVERDGVRFSLLVVVKEFAAGRLDPAERPRVELRHAAWYAQFGTREAVVALDRHGGTDRLRVLALDRENLVAACLRACRHGAGSSAVDALRAANAVLAQQGPLALAIELADAVLAVPDLTGREGAHALHVRATTRFALGQREACRAELEEVLRRGRGDLEPSFEVAVLRSLAKVSVDAAAPLERVWALHEEGAPGVAYTLDLVGVRLGRERRLEEARSRFVEALALHRAEGCARGEAHALGHLGNVEAELGRFAEAHRYFEASAALHRATGNLQHEAKARCNLAQALVDLGRTGDAVGEVETAVAGFREMGDVASEARYTGAVGDLLRELGRPDEARPHYVRSAALARSAGHAGYEAMLRTHLADLDREQGRLDDALAGCEAALAIARGVDDRRGVVFALTGLARIAVRRGDPAGARERLADARLAAEGLEHPELARALRAAAADLS